MIFCISIDLDPLSCYREIFGLEAHAGTDPVVATALPRFCELLLGFKSVGTVFVVGNTLQDPDAQGAVKQAHAAGHEISNHSLSHSYQLSRLSPAQILQEVEGGAASIEGLCGARPLGFRAPGYLLGPHVLDAVVHARAIYDSSILPSPLYQGVKAGVMGWLKLRGKTSRALLGDPREALALHRPYRPDPQRPAKPGNAPLLELPISSILGVPLTGAALALAGTAGARLLGAAAARMGFVNLELHGVDLLDLQTDGLDPRLSVQRDLRIPWKRKAQAIHAFVEKLQRSHRTLTLAQAAKWLG